MPKRRLGLGGRLFLSYLLVISMGVATQFAVASLLTPALFADHMARMGGMGGMSGMMGRGMDAAMDALLASAFSESLTQSLVLAAVVSSLAALLLSLLAARRIVRPLRRLVRAARHIAAGHYGERVPVTAAGDELDALAAGFNEMAGALEATERRRLELIGDITHELRTPVATLEGYLEGLLDGVVEPSAETWARLHDEAGRLRRLVDDLQELSRAEAGQLALTPRPVAPAEIVRTAVERLRGAFDEKGLALTSEVRPDLPLVVADEGRAVQVLTNLLTNALRYTPAPGRVTLSAWRAEGMVAIAVRDTGIGFAAEHAPRLFERFYRVDRSRSRSLGGAGVGLTIARALVEAMGGRIQAESPGPGQGSTFTFTLPVAGERVGE